MKKQVLALFFLVFAAGLTYGDTGPLGSGFSIGAVMGLPLSTYGMESGADYPAEWEQSFILGGQMGNRWYIRRSGEMGFGLMVNWFDVVFAEEAISSSLKTKILDISVLELGPLFSYRLDEKSAVDLYYNLRPTFLTNRLESDGFVFPQYDGGGVGNAVIKTNFGIAHTIGIAYRYQFVFFGLEYVFGGLPSLDLSDHTSVHPYLSREPDLRTDSIRAVFGLKF